MLRINMACLSGKELEDAIVRHCSCYGAVKKLRVYPAEGTLARPFALADMETAEQAESLAAAFGRLTMGNAVVVILQQDQVETPALLPTRSDGPAPDDTLTLILDELKRQS